MITQIARRPAQAQGRVEVLAADILDGVNREFQFDVETFDGFPVLWWVTEDGSGFAGWPVDRDNALVMIEDMTGMRHEQHIQE